MSVITKILNLFRKKPQKFDPYAYMGSVGVSPEYMMMYQESVNKIREYEESLTKK